MSAPADGAPLPRIVLFAHGSKDPDWAAPFEELRARAAGTLGDDRVRLAFLEFSSPDLAACVREAARDGVSRLLVIPLFFGEGRHVRRDLPALARAASRDHPEVALEIAGPLTDDEGVRRAMLARVLGLAARAVLGLVLCLLLLPGGLQAQQERLRVEVEGGPVWQSYNDVEIPNDGSATRFSLERLAGSGPWPAGRLYLEWRLAEKHALRLLIAPLGIEATGAPATALRFAGTTYEAGVPTEATYVFDSYRLSWRYRAHRGERTEGWVGFTAKVRDARVQLRQEDRTSRKDDLGFVPLLHLAGAWRFASDWALTADVDGLAGGPGRAVDAAVRAERRLGERVSLGVGYRTVEGGADVADVYTFAWLHYAVVSLAWRP